MRRIVWAIAVGLLCVGCFAQNSSERNNSTADSGSLPLPAVPASLRLPNERAAYVIEHFWDEMDWKNSAHATDRKWLEQPFVDFLSVFPIADTTARRTAVDNLMNNARTNPEAYAMLGGLAEQYLYQTDSPMKDEETYILFLENIVNSPVLDDAHRVRPAIQLENALKNRPGTLAANFEFESRDGNRMRLGDIKPKGDIVLIFYDPDCSHCNETMAKIQDDPKTLPVDGDATVVAVYSGDSRDFWDETKSGLPSDWIVGYEDGTLQDDGVYVIRSLPSIYILDKDGRVKVKELQVD